MDSVLVFFNQPIVITLVTLVVGSYAISLITERRARRNTLRDKGVEFITGAGSSINRVFPHLYGRLRTGRVEWDQTLDDELHELFSKRMWIQIGSQAYLKSETFHVQYFQLLDEVMGVVQLFREVELAGDTEQTRRKIRDNCDHLIRSWPLVDEAIPSSTQQSGSELVAWLDAIMHRVTALLVESLDSVLSGNR